MLVIGMLAARFAGLPSAAFVGGVDRGVDGRVARTGVAQRVAEEERVALTGRIADLLGQARVGIGQGNDFQPLLDWSRGPVPDDLDAIRSAHAGSARTETLVGALAVAHVPGELLLPTRKMKSAAVIVPCGPAISTMMPLIPLE